MFKTPTRAPARGASSRTSPQASSPSAQTPTFSGAPMFYSAHNRNNTNVKGDYFNSDRGTQNISRGSPADDTPPEEPQQPLYALPAVQPLSLQSIGEELKDSQHGTPFFRNAEKWLDDEDQYIRGILERLLAVVSNSDAHSTWVKKVRWNLPKVYPRLFVFQAARILFSGAQDKQRTVDLKTLYDSHIGRLARLVDSAYTQDDIADSIGETLQKLETLPSLATGRVEPELDDTIAKIWELDFAGVYAQRKLLRQESETYHSMGEDE
ncbi:hypothetical protein HWV62_13481 [Athelia sp. TMB]|nr:hypothetical protein HWV62_13481 [Athelia sp. TMB]